LSFSGLVRFVRYTETPLGRIPTQIDYDNYRELDSVKVPFRWTPARPDNRFTVQLEQVQDNVPVDDGKFTPPAQPHPLQP
jgi:photosynthetic reaction center cytochrome c subunit